ncbi:MAG TPA: 30S ribosomal protein S3, partial [Dehalococcoidia bacterium]|nr:30S ribosomal protein S3 [Dehalococcoidia bacterium]
IYDWKSKWYADRTYTELLHEDLAIRNKIKTMLPDAGISKVEIERNANQVTVSISTARPGIVIGRGGQRVDELRTNLEKLSGRKLRVNITEVRVPEVEAPLVARAVAEQIERRVSHRRAIKQAAMRAMQRGAQGVRIRVAGRLGGADMSRVDQERQGRVPLHTLKADVDYGTSEARTTLGRIGVKVWIYKGDRLAEERERQRQAAGSAEQEAPEAEAAAATPAAAVPEDSAPTDATPAAEEAPAPEPAADEPAADEPTAPEPTAPEPAAPEPAAPEPEAAPAAEAAAPAEVSEETDASA